MAHSGHCGGHSHVHYYRRRSRGSSSWGEFFFRLSIIAVILLIVTAIENDKLRGRHPLEGEYETYSSYLIDNEEYFYNTQDMIDGLKYWKERTNVQIVVMSATGSWSDAKALDKYYELFDDGAHVVIICPIAWYTSNTYYAIGDLADKVVDDDVIMHLIKQVDNSRNGSKWKEELKALADMIIEE